MKDILLVDDEIQWHMINTKFLEVLGFSESIQSARNGKQALELLSQRIQRLQPLPDLILLDLNMPILDGFGFLSAFQALDLPGKDKVKIVVTSSSIRSEDISKAKFLGASDYLIKPIFLERLRQLLNT